MASAPTWQTPKDLPLRKHVIERIRGLLQNNNCSVSRDPAFPEAVKKLELLLYSRAKSQAEYADRGTLQERVKSAVGGEMSDSSEVAANSGDSGRQLPSLLTTPCVDWCLYDEERDFRTELDLQLQQDLPVCNSGCLDFESGGDLMGCSAAFESHEKASTGSLDGKLLDAPRFDNTDFGDSWLPFLDEDPLSSEDSCAMNGYGGAPATSEMANNSFMSPWVSPFHEEMPLPCGSGSGSLGYLDPLPVPDVFHHFESNCIRQPQSRPYEGVPVSMEGYGTFPGMDMESYVQPLPSLSPSIFPLPGISQGEVKKPGINKYKPRPKTSAARFIKPRPLSRRWGLSTELQEDISCSRRSHFVSKLRKEDIDPLVHAYSCVKSNCGIMCNQLKKLLNHVKKCDLRKTPMKCSSCQWMGLLLSMHAQKCNIKCCPLPCCSQQR